jgi:hypothetical protein
MSDIDFKEMGLNQTEISMQDDFTFEVEDDPEIPEPPPRKSTFGFKLDDGVEKKDLELEETKIAKTKKTKGEKVKTAVKRDVSSELNDQQQLDKRDRAMPEAWTRNAGLMTSYKLCKQLGLKMSWGWINAGNTRLFQFRATWRTNTWSLMSQPHEHHIRTSQLQEVLCSILTTVVKEHDIVHTSDASKKKDRAKSVDISSKKDFPDLHPNGIRKIPGQKFVGRTPFSSVDTEQNPMAGFVQKVLTEHVDEDGVAIKQPAKKRQRSGHWFQKGECASRWNKMMDWKTEGKISSIFRKCINKDTDTWIFQLKISGDDQIEITMSGDRKVDRFLDLYLVCWSYVMRGKTGSIVIEKDVSEYLSWSDVEEANDDVPAAVEKQLPEALESKAVDEVSE